MYVLLINPPWFKRRGNIWKGIASCMPPLGLAQLAAYLENKNIQTRILDAPAEELYLDDISNKLRQEKESPSFIGITATTSIINGALEVARISKDIFPDAKIVMGGVHPSVLPEEVLSNKFVDYVVRGEGEETFCELISGKSNFEILGLSYKDNGAIKHNSNRSPIHNLDELPMPAYHLLPMEKYHPALGSYKRLPAVGIITTRGCPGNCTFCFGQYFGKRIRMRSAGKILEEIKLLQKDYGIKEISFYDDTFTALRNNVIEFCQLIIKENINITWSCFARVDFVNEELLLLMNKAGCHQICYGVESGNEQILKNIKKKISLEKARTAIKLTKKAGIEARATFMLGNPGETESTMIQTLKFALELDPDIALFNITTPYPGTEMYAWALENDYLITQDWSKYDLSQPIMKLPGLDLEELQRFYRKAHFAFYRRPKYIIKRLLSLHNLTELKASFRAFQTIINQLWD